MKGRILILDDEPSLARAIEPVFLANGWTVFCASTAAEGLSLARAQSVDVVLLDLGLPDADGKELIPHFKRLQDVEVIVVSARHQEAEKVAALDAGADDYVDKPFSIDVLAARIRAAQRRIAPATEGRAFASADLTIDFDARAVRLLGEPVKLSPKEYELLRALADHAGRVVTQRRLLIAGWGDPQTDPQYLRSYIALLRQKLEADPAEPRILLTEPGVGYRLLAD